MRKLKKNVMIKINNTLLRVLEVKDDSILVIDCDNLTMPKWITLTDIPEYKIIQDTLSVRYDLDSLDSKSKKFAHEHFTLIAPILPFVGEKSMRDIVISRMAQESGYSKQTIRNNLCLYLAYQNIGALAPKRRHLEKELSQDEKNMRWALNKYFYNRNQNSLRNAYTMMLKERYSDKNGILLPVYPSVHQFRYFYRKTKKLQTYYISRMGMTDYQRNHRPLLGEGIREFASCVGYGMADSTKCDIYLIDESGNLVGRPLLTACVDAYSGICYGYSLTWEGGVYSLRNLLLNIVSPKKEHCSRFGISIKDKDWDCDKLPGVLIADKGREYDSGILEQITELGVTVINLPSYRPELKGIVEKFFDIIQGLFKPHLKGKGVIMTDFRERGSHDYRKDACLTLRDFEKIILRCIIYYNTRRVIENYPFTDGMIKNKIQPFSNCIWEYGKRQENANLIDVKKELLMIILLPRTQGRFTRKGLLVNKLRYRCNSYNFTERYLTGGMVTVAYNPENASSVWLLDNEKIYLFEVIESSFKGLPFREIEDIQKDRSYLVRNAEADSLQAKIELIDHIINISDGKQKVQNTKDIKNTQKKEQNKTHIDFMEGGYNND